MTRAEPGGVNPARPRCQMGEFPGGQLIDDGWRGHGPVGGSMESPQERIGQGWGCQDPHAQIFGKAGVEGSGEGQSQSAAGRAGGPTQRTFGGDMDRIRPESGEPSDEGCRRGQGKPDFRIGRAGKGFEKIRGDQQEFVALSPQGCRCLAERGHNPINLRMPGIGCYTYFHRFWPQLPPVGVIDYAIPQCRADRHDFRQARYSFPPSHRYWCRGHALFP